jgi:hypothetical protein
MHIDQSWFTTVDERTLREHAAELHRDLSALCAQRERYYYAVGAAHQWRHAVRWLIGELRTVREELAFRQWYRGSSGL